MADAPPVPPHESAQRWAALMQAADRAMAEGAAERAAELFAAAAARAREAGAPEALGTSLHRLCVLRDRQGRHDEARWFADQALAVDEDAHGPVHPAVARDLHGRGLAALGAGDAAAAEADLGRSAAISRRLSSPRELLLTLLALGRAAHASPAPGDHGAAAFAEARALAGRLPGALPYALHAENGLAEAALKTGDPRAAHAHWVATTRLGAGPEAELRWRDALAAAWEGLGRVARAARADPADAAWMHSLALRALGPRPHPVGARALAALDALGAAPRLAPDAPLPPDRFVVVAWAPGRPAGDLAHPFGGRHSVPAAAAPDGLAVGDWVRVAVADDAIAQLTVVAGP